MLIVTNFINVLKKYCTFKGRASRQEYWLYTLAAVIIGFSLSLIDQSIGSPRLLFKMGIFGTIFALATALPDLGVTIRRLHDCNRSGFWFFILLIPFIGFFILIILLALKGNVGENQYGLDPKQVAVQENRG